MTELNGFSLAGLKYQATVINFDAKMLLMYCRLILFYERTREEFFTPIMSEITRTNTK